MTTRKGSLVLFALANFLLGYIFPYVFLFTMGVGLFVSLSAFYIAMAAMLIYFILIVLLDYILIRWLLKEKWFVWMGAALALFIAAIYISYLFMLFRYA